MPSKLLWRGSATASNMVILGTNFEAANAIGEEQIKEKITCSRQFSRQQANPDFVRQFEEQIREDLEHFKRRMEGANDDNRGQQSSRQLAGSLSS